MAEFLATELAGLRRFQSWQNFGQSFHSWQDFWRRVGRISKYFRVGRIFHSNVSDLAELVSNVSDLAEFLARTFQSWQNLSEYIANVSELAEFQPNFSDLAESGCRTLSTWQNSGRISPALLA